MSSAQDPSEPVLSNAILIIVINQLQISVKTSIPNLHILDKHEYQEK